MKYLMSFCLSIFFIADIFPAPRLPRRPKGSSKPVVPVVVEVEDSSDDCSDLIKGFMLRLVSVTSEERAAMLNLRREALGDTKEEQDEAIEVLGNIDAEAFDSAQLFLSEYDTLSSAMQKHYDRALQLFVKDEYAAFINLVNTHFVGKEVPALREMADAARDEIDSTDS